MNAYLIDYLERDFQDFVFANIKKDAEQKFLAVKSTFGSKLKYPDESNIRIKRCKKLDNCEKLLKLQMAEKLITVFGSYRSVLEEAVAVALIYGLNDDSEGDAKWAILNLKILKARVMK